MLSVRQLSGMGRVVDDRLINQLGSVKYDEISVHLRLEHHITVTSVLYLIRYLSSNISNLLPTSQPDTSNPAHPSTEPRCIKLMDAYHSTTPEAL
jgi:hypothetical protein